MLAYGYPVHTMIVESGLDERTAVDWHGKVGHHTRGLQVARICQGHLDVERVQAMARYACTLCRVPQYVVERGMP
jgi:hypothetical protein